MSAADEAVSPALPPAVAAAREVVAGLVADGVRDVVVSPGSRSAALAYALAAADAAGLLTLHVRIDERAAAFLALGLSRGSRATEGPGGLLPVAVVTTSGTAAANLHPAVLEAHHAGVPLVLLTADRPHELRGTGANQTTDQVGLYGSAVRQAADVPAPDGRPGELGDLRAVLVRALSAARGVRSRYPGPVHLNLAFREPLVPPAVLGAIPSGADASQPSPERTLVAGVRDDVGPWPLDPSPATVLVAGDGAGADARRLAEARGWPLLAEASSGAAAGSHAIAAHRLVLGVLGEQVERVVVMGRPTLSRPVQRLLARAEVEVLVVAPGGGPWPDAARSASAILPGVPAEWWSGPAGDPTWLDLWRGAGEAARKVVADRASAPGPTTPLAVAAAVAEASGPDDVLVVGSSNPVRDLDLVVDWDVSPLVLANRGLAGIDGMLSTATGVALSAARAGRRTRAVVGDLTFLHDVGGLLRGPHEPAADLQVVVVNDDGGSIFATLEYGALAEDAPGTATAFERVFSTPHGADLAALCAGYGVRHRLVTNTADLRAELARVPRGVEVVEVRVERTGRRAEGTALAADVAEAVRRASPRGRDGRDGAGTGA
ncbi:2-succinyl-5-enolpyruvyl-6-hydroxy-3-cyclohexene-1-carboxylic-acid synthase [Oerskovia sp. KBS0722]|uniref:2-succinyl-5-enolpyruvyl-6-hydroxy-3- cyclohexene-1-carboxylic-acid synthase n=1 Tax=Oerskovia sp. KBS0722 TaxID=1179673 RepID=UPI00110F6007|nr:2-succinyl-5-enolpyruvyl-6-hydroxy-3-cyclohexene-1-carboxylic-acid synthase [Oerskovia sp. KBS0722]QDW62512.1 2-succinyl-5-enolpyruvyl-6-hydroxy-3-cyclohexene-1-carboxylic-acid synthase [Oerskovia sp. KBS0722]